MKAITIPINKAAANKRFLYARLISIIFAYICVKNSLLKTITKSKRTKAAQPIYYIYRYIIYQLYGFVFLLCSNFTNFATSFPVSALFGPHLPPSPLPFLREDIIHNLPRDIYAGAGGDPRHMRVGIHLADQGGAVRFPQQVNPGKLRAENPAAAYR